MKINKLPKKAYLPLKERGIKKGVIEFLSPMDLGEGGNYQNGFIFITHKMLGVIEGEPDSGQVRYFGGTLTSDVVNGDEDCNYTLTTYPVEDVEKMYIEKLPTTNRVIAVIKGEAYGIGALTNLHMKEMNQLIKGFKAIKYGEQPEEETEEIKKITYKESELYCPKCGTMYPDPERRICPKCMSKKSIFSRTMKYFLKYKKSVITMFVCYVVSALLNLVWPYLSGTVLYDKLLKADLTGFPQFIIDHKNMVFALLMVVAAMVATKIVQQIVKIIQDVVVAVVSTHTIRDMKKDVFNNMEKLSVGFFVSKQTGSLMTRVLSDAERITTFFLEGLPYIFIHGFTIISSYFVMFKLDVWMALTTCFLLPVLAFISVKLQPKLWNLFGSRHRAERSVNSRVNDNITGVRVVKAFGKQDSEMERFEPVNERLRQADIKIVKYNNIFRIVFNLVQEISNIWVWILGVILILRTDNLETGVLITFVGYVALLSGPMNFFSGIMHMWSDSINAAQRMFEIIDAIPEIKEDEKAITPNHIDGKIELKNVVFSYERNRPILKDISMEVEPGKMLGIIGRSGAGKSTLVNLISRLYDPDEGNIYIDGVDIKKLSFEFIRKNVAMVTQDTYIFIGTVADNIAYGVDDVSREDIMRAAFMAGAHKFISKLPDGYDTVIGASGKDLSGGEKQRISIARAILKNPKILILDEATASVDTETEKNIIAALDELVKGRTTLSIAHRLSTLKDADRLVVLDNGRIKEEGTHAELLELDGIYAHLLNLQTQALQLNAF